MENIVQNFNSIDLKRDLEELFQRTRAKLGKEDVDHITRISRISIAFEIVGRLLIHISFEPITFIVGVIALWVHKQIEGVEMGHNIQHGSYERIPGAEKFHRKNQWYRFHSRLPLHAPSWRYSHNGLHHGYTNVVGKDPDARLYLRNSEKKERRWYHRLLFLETAINWPNILFNANIMASGLFDAYLRDENNLEVLPDKSWKNIWKAHKRAFAGVILYTLREYIFFPLLAGPNFAKVLLGNWLSSLMRNLFTAPALYASHINTDVETFPHNKQAADRAEWYLMQIKSTQNFEVPYFASILVGGLDYQIEHHLCPKLPPNRLREIAPEVRRICEKHGVRYNSNPWRVALRLVFAQLKVLNHA